MDQMRRGFQQFHLEDQSPPAENEHEVLPPILRSEYTDALFEVIKKLDYFAFVKLSKTGRYLHGFCWETMGIKIPFNCVLDVNVDGFQVWLGEKSHFYNEHHRKSITTAQFEKVLEKKLFYIQLELIHIKDTLDEASMAKTNEYLTGIGCEITERLWIDDVSLDMEPELLIQFVKNMSVKEFRCDSRLPGESVRYFLENLTSFHYDSAVPDDFFIISKVPPRLHLMGANSYSFDDFMKILKGWANFDFEIDDWNLGSNFHPSDYLFVDNFLRHFEWLHVVELFDLPLPPARPLLLLQWKHFPRYLLRADGQILGIFYSKEGVKGLYLRQLKFSQLRKKLPKLFPTTDGRSFDKIP